MTHSEKILAALKQYGAGHHDKIATGSRLQPEQVWKRLKELETAGLIYKTGGVAKLQNGKNATVWDLCKQGEYYPKNKKPFGRFDRNKHVWKKGLFKSIFTREEMIDVVQKTERIEMKIDFRFVHDDPAESQPTELQLSLF